MDIRKVPNGQRTSQKDTTNNKNMPCSYIKSVLIIPIRNGMLTRDTERAMCACADVRSFKIIGHSDRTYEVRYANGLISETKLTKTMAFYCNYYYSMIRMVEGEGGCYGRTMPILLCTRYTMTCMTCNLHTTKWKL